MTTLDILLEQNYDTLSSDECKIRVMQFIRETPSVLDYDIVFIKKLTKVANHVLKSDPDSLDEFLERVFDFNIEGVKKIRAGLDGYTQNNLLILESHFLTYAGDAAKALFEKTSDLSWAEKWYNTEKLSADMTIGIEPQKAVYSYSFAGDAARVLFKKTDDINWAKKQYDAYEASGVMSVTTDPQHAAYVYGHAGDAAKALFEKTSDLSWAEKWYNTKKLSADMTIGIEPQFAAHTFCLAGDAARMVCKELPKRTRKIKWAKRAIECYNNFLDYYKLNPNPQMEKLIDKVNSDISFLGRFLYKK